jgi:hypothetical protein
MVFFAIILGIEVLSYMSDPHVSSAHFFFLDEYAGLSGFFLKENSDHAGLCFVRKIGEKRTHFLWIHALRGLFITG